MPLKNITYNQFIDALGLVTQYRKQTKQQTNLQSINIPKGRTIDLTGKLPNSLYKVLLMYYKFNYGLEINLDDLSNMHANLLAAIDYEEIKKFRGIGSLGISKMQKIIEFNLEQQEV